MPYRIEEQVEKIIDEARDDRLQVIVRIGSNDESQEPLLRFATDAIRQRNMSFSARELLPGKRRKTPRPVPGKRATTARGMLRAVDKSLATPNPDALKEARVGYLAQLLSSEIVRKALAETVEPRNKRSRIRPPSFWTSSSVLLEISKADLERLPKDVPKVRGIYPNRALRIPRLVEVKNLPAAVLENKASSWGVNIIGALAAWGAYGTRGKGVKIGLLDTGVDANHPDLKGKVEAWAEFDAEGRRVVGSKPHDTDKHGTHCAGIIAGGNASGQWIGVAPEAKLAVALVMDGRTGGTDAQVLAGIDWLVEQGVDVISMSLGGLTLDPETPDTYTEAILTCLRAGIPVVTAIGNEGNQTTGSPGNDIFAFSVGATDYLDRPAGFSGGRTHIIRNSNFIPPEYLPLPYYKPEISAPGVAIKSSVPGKKWATFSGTSMATPHVAGAMALLLSATSIRKVVEPNERAFIIQDLITGSAEELGEAGQDHRYGFGRINVLRAIGFAIERGY
ncbi:MAG: S8 family serine peptidase [candidate division KSB1 bacterium]|nr:S8 family serine peptidase [candidate division KSB1 bacterium]MDZ7301995.1 S8 family serine peptidase [candidate division KSB1 bacterium]MDZ7310177.1 S8 family serine peptidase [candidate division KSB1 bacterium]